MSKLPIRTQLTDAKKPMFHYVYAYCIARDLTEEDALEEIAEYAGTTAEAIKACYYNHEALNELSTGVTLAITQLFYIILNSVQISRNNNELPLIPPSFDVGNFVFNNNKQKWFGIALKDEKRLHSQNQTTNNK